ncbi:hypothetical protein [Actinophytocola sediminis]
MAERHSWAVGAVAGVGQVDELDARLTIGGLIVPSGAVTSHGGMFPAATTPGDVTATTPTPNGEVHVAPFRGALQSIRPGGGGVYIICLDAIKTIDVLGTAPADPANPRIDLVVFQQSDTYHGDADSDFVVRHVVGTPAVVPVDPDPTAGGLSPDYILKARINVAAGAITIEQSDIQAEDPGITVAVGGVLPVPNQTWRDAIVNPYNGMPIYRHDRNWVEVRDDTAWRVQGVAVCSSLADRTAAITNPANGTTSYRTDNDALDVFDGAVWRGTRQVSYDTPAATGSGANAAFAAAQNTTYTLASLVIPDPGFPYRIAGRAGMRLTAVTSNIGYISHAGSITVDSTVQPEISAPTENHVVSASFLELTGTNFPTATGFLNLPYRRARTVYTGGHTVRFLFKSGLQGTLGWGPLNTQADYYFEVDVVPA